MHSEQSQSLKKVYNFNYWDHIVSRWESVFFWVTLFKLLSPCLNWEKGSTKILLHDDECSWTGNGDEKDPCWQCLQPEGTAVLTMSTLCYFCLLDFGHDFWHLVMWTTPLMDHEWPYIVVPLWVGGLNYDFGTGCPSGFHSYASAFRYSCYSWIVPCALNEKNTHYYCKFSSSWPTDQNAMINK